MQINDIVLLEMRAGMAAYVVLHKAGERIHLENVATGRSYWEYLNQTMSYKPHRIGRRYRFLGFKFDLYYHEEEFHVDR